MPARARTCLQRVGAAGRRSGSRGSGGCFRGWLGWTGPGCWHVRSLQIDYLVPILERITAAGLAGARPIPAHPGGPHRRVQLRRSVHPPGLCNLLSNALQPFSFAAFGASPPMRCCRCCFGGLSKTAASPCLSAFPCVASFPIRNRERLFSCPSAAFSRTAALYSPRPSAVTLVQHLFPTPMRFPVHRD